METQIDTTSPQNKFVLTLPMFLLIVLGILIVLISGLTIYKLKLEKVVSPSKITDDSLATNSVFSQAVLDQIAETAKTNSKLIQKSSIQQQIEGTITQIGDNTWTLKNDDQAMTITNKSKNKIFYYLRSTKPGTQSKEVNAQELKIGDKVIVTQAIDLKTGNPTILSFSIKR